MERTPIRGSAVQVRQEGEGATLKKILVPPRPFSGVARWALGSVAERVMRSCSTPLLVKHTAGVAVSDAPTGG